MNDVKRTWTPDQLATLNLNQIKELRRRPSQDDERRLPPIERESQPGATDLSYAQEQMWLIDRIGRAGSTYNASVAVGLNGELRIEALNHSLAELTNRHEILRTRFEVLSGVPKQVVETASRLLPLAAENFTHTEGRRDLLKQVCDAEARVQFNLSDGPPIRIRLLKISETSHVLLLTLHHIITDGWSWGILRSEFAALYAAHVRGESASLPQLTIQYRDYARWQRRWIQGSFIESHLDYWRNALAGIPSQLEVPTDRSRPPLESFRGKKLDFVIDSSMTRMLKEFAREENATLFMVLLAAFQLLLSRLSGQRDVVVGSPVAGRVVPEVEGLIGVFVNTILFRTDVAPILTFRQLLRNVRNTTLSAYAHQNIPFEILVKELRPERDPSRQPLFQVMLVLGNYPETTLNLPGLDCTWSDADSEASHFDITLLLEETDSCLNGIIEFSSDLFDDATISTMIRQLRMVLMGIVKNSDIPIRNIPLLMDSEKERIVNAFSRARDGDARGLTILDLFENQVARTPAALAASIGEMSITYSELNCRARTLARLLEHRGIGPDSLVGICAERGFDMLVGLVGIIKTGAAYVPIDPTYPKERLTYILRDSKPAIVLAQEHLRSSVSGVDLEVITLSSSAEDSMSKLETNKSSSRPAVHPYNLAYVIYTSGSTGQPKGVMIQHNNLANLVNWHIQEFGLTNDSRTSSTSAFGFDASTWEVWPTLCSGGCILMPSNLSGDPAETLRWWQAQQFDVSFLATPLAEYGYASGVRNNTLRSLLVGGDRLRRWPQGLEDDQALINNYGPTETTVVATSGALRKSDRIFHIGKPILNTQTYILDECLQPVPIGISGEIYIGGAGVGRGYLSRPEATSERFLPNPFSSDSRSRLYKTGDLGRWLADGNIDFRGRNDNQVKVRGFRIELGEIESVLLGCPAVSQVAVVLGGTATREEQIVAYVVGDARLSDSLADDPRTFVSRLRSYLKGRLPEYMIPSVWIRVDQLPLTPNGKVDYRSLAKSPDLTSHSDTKLTPRTETERAVADIWKSVLAVTEVGLMDNFFELGGHSLLGMRLIAKVKEACNVCLPAVSIFQYPTVMQMAEAIESLQVLRSINEPHGATIDYDEGVL